MDLSARLIAKTVFLLDVLWKSMSRLYMWLKQFFEIFLTECWMICEIFHMRYSWNAVDNTIVKPNIPIPYNATFRLTALPSAI